MKSILALMIAAALAGCSSSSSHTVEVAGSSEDVSNFVAAEMARDANADVDYRTGQTKAMFSLRTEIDLKALAERAAEARLNIESKSSSYAFGTSLDSPSVEIQPPATASS